MAEEIDVVETVKAQDAGKDPERLALKYAAMRASAFSFFRGTCPLFYATLPREAQDFPAPRVWACGDLHLENFGAFKGDNGLVYFDVNDFDEALAAPAWADALRCAASVGAGHRELGLSLERAEELQELFLRRWAQALALGRAYWVESEVAAGRIGKVMRTLRDRRRRDFIASRVKSQSGKPRIRIDGERALSVDKAARGRAAELVGVWANQRPDSKLFEVVDVARRIAGLGSLGCERYVVLTRGEEGLDGFRLVDVKEAPASHSPLAACEAQPPFASQAERIVSTQRRMQARTPAWLAPVVAADGKSYVVRNLQPREDRLDLRVDRIGEKGLAAAISTMGELLAWAQLRASGRGGAADADALIDYGGRANEWRDWLLALASACAHRSEADYIAFATAYDAGAFNRRSF